MSEECQVERIDRGLQEFDVTYLYWRFKNKTRRRKALHAKSALNKAYKAGQGYTWEECGTAGPTDMNVGIGAKVVNVKTGETRLFYLYEWG